MCKVSELKYIHLKFILYILDTKYNDVECVITVHTYTYFKTNKIKPLNNLK